MKCAMEMAMMVAVKKVEEAKQEAERQVKLMENFIAHKDEIDKFIEQRLLNGDGKASIEIKELHPIHPIYENRVVKNAFYFVIPSYRRSKHCGWENPFDGYFSLPEFEKYLTQHCYKVNTSTKTYEIHHTATSISTYQDTVTVLNISI